MVRLGNQVPTFQTVGTWAESDGDYAIGLFGGYGVSFYESQEYELRLFLARDKDGRFAAKTIAISKPRQNGKSYAARFYAIWMAGIEGRKVLYSAHHGKTVRKMFKGIRDFVKNNPDWAQALLPGSQGIYSAEGREGIYFANGGMIEFATRTNAGGRGETYDVIIIDEAQELTDEQYDALMPTTIASESGDPQKIYIGTPPNEKCPGTVFRGLHDKAHAGEGGKVWWLEWAAAELGDVHDKELWYATNPALGYRIREDVFADAADSATSIDGFFREYLGWWSKTAAKSGAIDPDDWSACATKNPIDEGVLSCAVKFSLDGRHAALAVCLNPQEGSPHVEVVAYRSTERGTGWISAWILERRAKIAQVTIDGKAKAAALEAKLREKRLPKPMVHMATGQDVPSACSMLEDAVQSGAITHFDQPGLNASVTKCPRRKIGSSGGWGFGESESAVPEPAEAAALAYQAAMTTKRKPGRKAKIL